MSHIQFSRCCKEPRQIIWPSLITEKKWTSGSCVRVPHIFRRLENSLLVTHYLQHSLHVPALEKKQRQATQPSTVTIKRQQITARWHIRVFQSFSAGSSEEGKRLHATHLPLPFVFLRQRKTRASNVASEHYHKKVTFTDLSPPSTRDPMYRETVKNYKGALEKLLSGEKTRTEQTRVEL